jgi:hypothetical protein
MQYVYEGIERKPKGRALAPLVGIEIESLDRKSS